MSYDYNNLSWNFTISDRMALSSTEAKFGTELNLGKEPLF